VKFSRDSQLYRVVRWCVQYLAAFTGEPLHRDYDTQADLCSVVRLIVFWVPLVALVQISAVAVGVFALFVQPARLFGWHGVKVASIIYGCVAVFFIGVWIIDMIESSRKKEPRKDPEKPRMVDVALHYIAAKKSKICPLIEWGNE